MEDRKTDVKEREREWKREEQRWTKEREKDCWRLLLSLQARFFILRTVTSQAGFWRKQEGSSRSSKDQKWSTNFLLSFMAGYFRPDTSVFFSPADYFCFFPFKDGDYHHHHTRSNYNNEIMRDWWNQFLPPDNLLTHVFAEEGNSTERVSACACVCVFVWQCVCSFATVCARACVWLCVGERKREWSKWWMKKTSADSSFKIFSFFLFSFPERTKLFQWIWN